MLSKILKYRIAIFSAILFFVNLCMGEALVKTNIQHKSIVSSDSSLLSDIKVFSKKKQSKLILKVIGDLKYTTKWNKAPYGLEIFLQDAYKKNNLNLNILKEFSGVSGAVIKEYNNGINISLALASNFQAKALFNNEQNNLTVLVYTKPEVKQVITFNKKVKSPISYGIIKSLKKNLSLTNQKLQPKSILPAKNKTQPVKIKKKEISQKKVSLSKKVNTQNKSVNTNNIVSEKKLKTISKPVVLVVKKEEKIQENKNDTTVKVINYVNKSKDKEVSNDPVEIASNVKDNENKQVNTLENKSDNNKVSNQENLAKQNKEVNITELNNSQSSENYEQKIKKVKKHLKKKNKKKENLYVDDKETIYLVAGESKILTYQGLKRTAVGNPAVADVVVISKREVLVNGKTVGTTSLTLWGKKDRTTYKIIVKKDQLASKTKVFDLKNFWLKKYDYKTDEGKFSVTIATNTALVSELQKSLGTLLPDANFSINTELNNVVAQGSPQELKKVSELIKKLDVAPLQVLFEAKIIEVTDAANKELELNWLTQKNKYSGNFDAGATAASAGTAGGTITFDSLGALSEQYMLNLRALETQRKVNVLANPKMLTISGKLANILVGDKIPVTTTSVDTTGRTTSVEYIEVGVILHLVVTSFSSDGYVSVFVTPEVSTITGYTAGGYPTISIRTENSEVRLKDGESLVIGGLLSTQDIENLSKIPILGDMPFLGKLFQSKTKNKTNQEIILILTPHILNADNTFKVQKVENKK